MAAAAAPKVGAKGAKGLTKNKFVLVGVLAAGIFVFLYFRKKGTAAASTAASTGASTTSNPATDPNAAYPQGTNDSTGGGASGPDLSSLLDALSASNQATLAAIQAVGGGVSPGAGAGGLSTGATSGGTPTPLPNYGGPETTETTKPDLPPISSVIPPTLPGNNNTNGAQPGMSIATAPTLTATDLQNQQVRQIVAKTIGNTTPIAVKATPNKTGVSANAKQGVFSIH